MELPWAPGSLQNGSPSPAGRPQTLSLLVSLAGVIHSPAGSGPRRALSPPLRPPPGVLPGPPDPLLRPLRHLLLPLLQRFLLLQEDQHQFPLWQELVPPGCPLLAPRGRYGPLPTSLFLHSSNKAADSKPITERDWDCAGAGVLLRATGVGRDLLVSPGATLLQQGHPAPSPGGFGDL